MWGILVVVVLIVLLLAWAVSLYNRLVTLRNRFKNAFAQIDVQLKRRYDLIPNLVETAKGYMKHERETLEAVIAARNAARRPPSSRRRRNPGDAAAMQPAAGAEAGAHRRPGPAVRRRRGLPRPQGQPERWPQLQEELTSTENKVAFARQAYNDARDELQHRARDVPDRADRRHVRLPGGAACS